MVREAHVETVMVEDPMIHDSAPQQPGHKAVMVREVIACLAPQPGQLVVDATVGYGGHSLAILPHLLPNGRLIANDQDADALELARHRLAEFSSSVEFTHENFRDLPEALRRLGVAGVHGLVADLGMSSMQVETSQRGFSFQHEGPLDMRMDRRQGRTAAMLIQDST